MILLVLRDGTYAEVPNAVDVIHRDRRLRCIDAAGETLVSFNAAEVVAYTCNETSAERITTDDTTQADIITPPGRHALDAGGPTA